MKKTIISSITLFFLFPIMSANATSPSEPTEINIGGIGIPPEPWYPPANCFISQGEKRCTSCIKGPSAGSVDVNRRTGVRTEISKTCEKCTTTIEPLIRRKACKKDSDCVLVKPNCCGGSCEPIAVHKSQEGKYHNRLEKECAPPPFIDPVIDNIDGSTNYSTYSRCMCGTMKSPPKYKAICIHFPIAYEKNKKQPRRPRRPRSRCIVEAEGYEEVVPFSNGGSVQ